MKVNGGGMHAIWIGVVAVFAWGVWPSAAAAQAMGEDPELLLEPVDAASWTLTTDWGASTLPLDRTGDETEFRGAGGVRFLIRWPLGFAQPFAEASAFPLWKGIYSARAGLILGKRSAWNYTEWGETKGRVRSYVTWGDRVTTLTGLVAAARVDYRDGDAVPILEAGFAISGQHQFQGVGLYDPAAGTPGFRVELVHIWGRGKLSYVARAGLEIFLDFRTYPVPVMFTVGVGFGDGFGFQHAAPDEDEDDSEYDY